MKKKRYILIITVIIMVSIIIYLGIGGFISQKFDIQTIEIKARENGKEITIAHLSDLHIPKLGVTVNELITQIEEINPDLIFLTGDTIDSRALAQDFEQLEPLFSYIENKAKCYAVLGNHEMINLYLDEYKDMLADHNITLLQNSYQTIQIKDKEVTIVGINDNALYNKETISGLNIIDQSTPIILLAHRPEYWKEYISLSYSTPLLTLAGHAHGGQFKIFGKGLYSPNQGTFPKYYDGLYEDSGRYMVVSRGLGDSIFPLRIYNKYHLPVVKITL